jgi:hypothetical protein
MQICILAKKTSMKKFRENKNSSGIMIVLGQKHPAFFFWQRATPVIVV